ncbi:MAG: hypothetical protein ACNA8W_15990, partial [Bradymonadaceae bacterium]
RREFIFEDTQITVRDTVDLSQTDFEVESMACGSDATSIYVANSNNFQESVLLPWVELDEHVTELNQKRKLELPARRVFPDGPATINPSVKV